MLYRRPGASGWNPDAAHPLLYTASMTTMIASIWNQLIDTVRAQFVAEVAGDSATLSVVHSTQELLMDRLMAVYPVDRNAAWSCIFFDYEEAVAVAAKTGHWPYSCAAGVRR